MRRRGAQTSTRTRSVVALLCAGAALLLAPAAQAVDPLALARASPADGARVAPTPTGGIPWQIAITGVPPEAEVLVTVSTSPTLDPDGVLRTDDRADFFFLSESATTPGTYAGRSDPGPNAWSAVAATYYWQVTATWTDASGVFHSAASTVRRLVIGTPSATPPPSTAPGGSPSPARTTLAMSSLDATYYVRTLIRRRTGRPPVALRYACARLTSRSFRCRPRWRDSRNVSRGRPARARRAFARVLPVEVDAHDEHLARHDE